METIWSNLISTMLQGQTLVRTLSQNNEICVNNIEANSNSLYNLLNNYSNQ